MEDHFLLAMALGVLAARGNRRVSSRKRAQNRRNIGVAGSEVENQVAPAAADPAAAAAAAAAGSGGDDQVEIMRKTLAEPQGELLRKHVLFILDKSRSEEEGSSNDEQLMELAVAFVSTRELTPFLITITDEVEKAFDTDLGLLFDEREVDMGQHGGDHNDMIPAAAATGFPMTSGDTAAARRRLNMLCTVLCFLFRRAEEAAATVAPWLVPTHLAALFEVALQGLATSSNTDSKNDSDRPDGHIEALSSISSSKMLCKVVDAYLSAFCCSDDTTASQSSSYMGPVALAQAENVVLETLAQLHDSMGESLKELSRQLACKVEESIEWGK